MVVINLEVVKTDFNNFSGNYFNDYIKPIL